MKLPKVLPSPKRPKNLTKKAKWLSGEGAGSWFEIFLDHGAYRISRISPTGILECSGQFKASELFTETDDWEMSYPSHCGLITVLQNNKRILFTPI